MVDIKKPWHVKITKDSYKILNKWWENGAMTLLNIYGICGMYINTANKLVIGQTEGVVKKSHFDFGKLLTLNEFKTYILKEKNRIYELW